MFWSLVAAQLIAEPVLAGRRYALRCPQRACCVTGGGCVEAPDAPAHPLDGTRMLSTFVASPLRARVCPDLRITVALPASSPRFVFPWWLIPRVLFPRRGASAPVAWRWSVEGARWHHASEHCCALSHCRAHCAVAQHRVRHIEDALGRFQRYPDGAQPDVARRGRGAAVSLCRAQWALDAPPLRRVEGDLSVFRR
ncbi:hypothetical protein ERJ75_000581400 [Trypanosoma vivax]|nr:hypothetical protein ERJ75_000581400 [Trypanosoma vivax]